MKALRTLRRIKDLTLADVARPAGISTGHLSRVESGERTTSRETINRILAAIDGTPRPDPESQFCHDVARPVAELKAEAAALNSLLSAIVVELRAGGDRVALARLAEVALERATMILAAVKAQADSLPDRVN